MEAQMSYDLFLEYDTLESDFVIMEASTLGREARRNDTHIVFFC